MKVFIDENMPAALAQGLSHLVKPRFPDVEVLAIKEYFSQGIQDDQWIPKVGQLKAIVITQDFSIHSSKELRNLYMEHEVGLFFLKPPSKTGYKYWEMVVKVISLWEQIMKIASHDHPPFAYRNSAGTNKFEKFN
jgi:hypothetical protein